MHAPTTFRSTRGPPVGDERRSVRVRGDLLNFMAHGLATPLTPIAVHLHLLRAGPLTDDQARSVDAIARNLRRLREHVEDVATALRLQRGEVHVENSVVDLPFVVRAAFVHEADAAREAGVTLSASGEAVDARADPDLATEIIVHLVRHAVRATLAGGHVHVATLQEGGDVVVRVLDSGGTVPWADRASMFDFGAGDIASRGPAGFDLYLAAAFAELSGGNVFHEATEKGTLIAVAFPRSDTGGNLRRIPALRAAARSALPASALRTSPQATGWAGEG